MNAIFLSADGGMQVQHLKTFPDFIDLPCKHLVPLDLSNGQVYGGRRSYKLTSRHEHRVPGFQTWFLHVYVEVL